MKRIPTINKIAELELDNKFYNTKLAEFRKFKCDDEMFVKRRINHYKTLIKNNNKLIKKWLTLH